MTYAYMQTQQRRLSRSRSEHTGLDSLSGLRVVDSMSPSTPEQLAQAAAYLRRRDAEDLADMLGLVTP